MLPIERKSIFKITRDSSLVCLFLLLIQVLTIFGIYDDNIKENHNRIDTIVKTEGFDLTQLVSAKNITPAKAVKCETQY